MTAGAAHDAAAGGPGLRPFVGAALAVVFALLTWLQAPWTDRLQSAWFDAYQALGRARSRAAVTVVEIDQKSLTALGQWPWPRTQLTLVTTCAGRPRRRPHS